MKNIFSFFSKKILIYLAFCVVVIVIIIVKVSGSNGKQVVAVGRMDIIQEVAATGNIKPNQSVDLGFDKSGRVENVYAFVGDMVKKGQILVTLESGEVSADLLKARASLQEENINLREIRSTAPISHNDAYKNLEAAVKEGFGSADDSVRNRVDQFFKNTSDNPKFEVSITSGNFVHYFNVPSEILIDLNNGRSEIENILNDWQKRTNTLSPSNIVTEASRAIDDLNTISAFLDKIASTVNTFTPSEFAYETTVNTYKATISAARTEVSGAISIIVSAKDKFNSAPTPSQAGEFEDVLAQESKVKQAEAAVASLEAGLGKSVMKAPFDGVVTLEDAKIGGSVSPGNTLVSIISQNEMYIEANISEVHIGKVAVGNPVSITFDAFPTEEFSGEVSYIEPGDVVIDGIVNYKIRVSLTKPDARIKNGLTANLKIQTTKKENVLSIPLYAVTKEGDQNFVNKISGQKQQKVPVTLGISGNNGFAEILSGLNEGDMVEF